MSDHNRTTLITVGAPKSAKANVIKTVRLTINLDESNESKYPELNYKELVFAEESHRKQNGKTGGLDPFSDNDDDVERVARKFEQKYGGKSTYGRKKARTKQDDFADIGAGYDENDPFIDNTHGYDEMIPPECDTLYGGFYINSGSLEFKTVPRDRPGSPDTDNRRNKRRISSSSSSEDSSESSSSDSDKREHNGEIDAQHRKKKNKKIDKKKAKKIRRTDSSAATSGKQTSDENNGGDAESVDCGDSRTSDSLASKPAPSSETAATSDSSRDTECKDSKLPHAVLSALESLETHAPAVRHSLPACEPHIIKLEQALSKCSCSGHARRAAWTRAAAALGLPRARLLHRARRHDHDPPAPPPTTAPPPAITTTTASTTTTTTTTVTTVNKRKTEDVDEDFSKLTEEQREAKIVETLERLKVLIEERKPSMLANYNAECERVQEERKKLQIAALSGATQTEKRLPKRRFPWCATSRALLARLARLAGAAAPAAALLARRALPLFPPGFVRMPTLLRQADLNKEIKVSDVKRQRLGSASQPAVTTIPNPQPAPAITNVPFTEPIQFPSSLTVTTSMKTSPDKEEDDKYKTNIFSSIRNTFGLSKDLIVEQDKKEDPYIPPNNIGSITITPVLNQKEKDKKNATDKQVTTSGLIRVKSPAALNDMVNKKEVKLVKNKEKAPNTKEKRVESPLHIDTSYQPSKRDPSPKESYPKKDPSPKDVNYKKDASPKDANYKKDVSPKDANYKKDVSPKDANYKKDVSPKDASYKKDISPKDASYKKDISPKEVNYKKEISPKGKDELSQKHLENMRVAENNIPRPTLVPVHHSPTFAKPDKRPPEVKKKKDVIVVSDVDPLSDVEPVNVDDSSSDVEVIETDKSDSLVPSDKTSVKSVPKVKEGKADDDAAETDIDTLMRNIRDLEHSQEPTKFNSNSYGGVITSAKHGLPQGRFPRLDPARDSDFTERTLNKMDGSNIITG